MTRGGGMKQKPEMRLCRIKLFAHSTLVWARVPRLDVIASAVLLLQCYDVLSNAMAMGKALRTFTITCNSLLLCPGDNRSLVSRRTLWLKGQCHENVAVLCQFWAKIVALNAYVKLRRRYPMNFIREG